LAATLALIK
jgi:hypothetical protein